MFRCAMQIGELAGLAVGSTVLLNVMFAGYFNPVHSSLLRILDRINCLSRLMFVRQANIRGVDESCKELGTCNGVARIQRHMDLHSVTHPWSSGWCMGVQFDQVHGQASARDHQECIIPQEQRAFLRRDDCWMWWQYSFLLCMYVSQHPKKKGSCFVNCFFSFLCVCVFFFFPRIESWVSSCVSFSFFVYEPKPRKINPLTAMNLPWKNPRLPISISLENLGLLLKK